MDGVRTAGSSEGVGMEQHPSRVVSTRRVAGEPASALGNVMSRNEAEQRDAALSLEPTRRGGAGHIDGLPTGAAEHGGAIRGHLEEPTL